MRKPDKVYVDEKREGKRYRVTEGRDIMCCCGKGHQSPL